MDQLASISITITNIYIYNTICISKSHISNSIKAPTKIDNDGDTDNNDKSDDDEYT